MIYKAGSRFVLRKECGVRLTSRSGTVIKDYPNSGLRRVLRDGLRTPDTWHVNWFQREHK